MSDLPLNKEKTGMALSVISVFMFSWNKFAFYYDNAAFNSTEFPATYTTVRVIILAGFIF